MKKKKILLLTLEFYPYAGGAGIYTADLAEGLARLDLDVVVLAPLYSEQIMFAEWDKKQNYRIIRCFNRIIKGLGLIKYTFALLKHIVKEKPNYIHSTDGISHKVGAISTFLFPLNVFITVHGSELYDFFDSKKENYKSSFLSFLLTKYFVKAKKIICVSKSTQNLLYSKFKEAEKTSNIVIYNGINLRKFIHIDKTKIEELRVQLGVKQNDLILLSVSRLDEEKGNDRVIETLPAVIKKFPSLKYLIVGDGPYKNDLIKLVDKLRLNKFVYFIGKIDSDKIMPFYSLSDIFILPSRRGSGESFGLVYVEAYFFKKPVIGTTHGGVPEVIDHETTGYTVNPNDTEEITKSLLNLLSNREKAKIMGENGYKLAIQKFNSDIMAKAVYDIYISSSSK
ncbi:MAG: glycosyltransferase family 4 protein [Flavobacteriaceae bacterium]|nr:glycosyltransferase family 4 protein [Flavobacteriaceae bacterium]